MWLSVVFAFCVFAPVIVLSQPVEKRPFQIRLLPGDLRVPFTFKVNGVEIGGLSGLAFNPNSSEYYAVVDGGGRPTATFYTLRLDVDEQGYRLIDILNLTPILDLDGTTFLPGEYDPEAIVYHPLTETLYWANERDDMGKSSVRQMRLDGTPIRELIPPFYHIPDAMGPNQTLGVRYNLGYQGLALTPDHRLIVANEAPLVQDGPVSCSTKGAFVRMLVYDVSVPEMAEGMEAQAEYAYWVDRVPTGFIDNGVADLANLNATHFLVLETARNHETPVFLSRLYVTSFEGATDLLAERRSSLEGKEEEVKVMKKTLIREISEAKLPSLGPIDRMDYIAFGPDLNGRRLFFTGTDNDFAGRPRFTQALAWVTE